MRWLVRVVGALLLLAFLSLAALFLIPAATVARLAAAQIGTLTGRALTIEGPVRPTVWPQLGIRTGAVTLANADWSGAGPMLQAEALSVAVDMAALIGGTVRVTGIDLARPRLLLERAADGRVNWNLTPAAAPSPAGAAPEPAQAAAATPFTIDRAVISDGALRYLDHATGQEIALTDIALDAAVPDFAGAAELTARAAMNGQAFGLEGTVGAFGPFLDGKVVPVALTAGSGASEAAFDGRMGLSPLAGEGRLDATLADPAAVFALFGQASPGLPQGLGRDRIAVAGQATLTAEGSVHLREGRITLDGNSFSGAVDLVPGAARPMLTADLGTGALDLSVLGGGSGGTGGGGTGKGGGGTPAAGWSTAPIDARGLGALDAAVSLLADKPDLRPARFGRTRLGLRIDAARAVIDLREVAAYGGNLAGQVIVNAGKGFSARANLALSGLALEPLLTEVAAFDRLSGTGDLRFNLLGSGGSVDALMRSLSGEGSLAFRQGELGGLDLAGMLRTMDAGYVGEGSKTVFDSLTGSFTMAGGVLSNGDLALAAPLVTARGTGSVDIGAQTLDYRLTPLTLGGKALDEDVQVPVLVTGAWSAPQVRLDLETLARRKLEDEAKRLEEKAKAEIVQKLQEETGVVPLEGESLEDTARRAAQQALQDEAARQLQKLLGGGSE